MKIKYLLSVSLLLLIFGMMRADRYDDYISLYSETARSEMEAFGIPASITLAQGLLESGAGKSRLAEEGRNHFGIKCHSDWHGETMLRSDDAPDECFRVYQTAAESYRDHSLFLTRKRYSSLFLLDPSDYASWARGLKQCGYATDPHYADRLIAIIERYRLNRFDKGAEEISAEMAEYIASQLARSRRVFKYRGLPYVVAAPGDTYAGIAAELGLSAEKVTADNDGRSATEEIKPWEEVYLKPKHGTPAEDAPSKITIGEGETIHSVAQRLAIREEVLRARNPKAKDRAGTKLNVF